MASFKRKIYDSIQKPLKNLAFGGLIERSENTVYVGCHSGEKIKGTAGSVGTRRLVSRGWDLVLTAALGARQCVLPRLSSIVNYHCSESFSNARVGLNARWLMVVKA